MDTQIDLVAFWTWWTRTLLDVLPSSMVSSLYASKSWLIVEPVQDHLKLSYQNRADYQALGEFDGSSESKTRLKNLLEQRDTVAGADVLVRIPESMGMRKLLSLPEAAAVNVRQMLGYELDRYTPFKAEHVYFDVVKLGKPLNGQLKLSLIMVQKSVLDVLTEQVLSLGLQPAYADYAQEPLTQLPRKERYNLLPLDLRHERSKRPRMIMIASILAVAAMLIVALVTPLWMASQGIDKLKSHARIVEKQALNIEESKRGIDYLYQSTEKLIAKKQNVPLLVETINTISQLLKDDTWVSQIKYSQGNLELLGESANAADILATLEKTHRFKNARFISPVTQDQTTHKERFQLSTEIISPAAENATKSQ